MSNYTHYSPSDPDARISVKPGKTRNLNYASQLTVDSSNYVITDIFADFANKKVKKKGCLDLIQTPFFLFIRNIYIRYHLLLV